MSISDALVVELRREALVTRRVLERVPDQHADWKPHAKSMSLGQLARHLASLPEAIVQLVTPLEVPAPRFAVPDPEPVAAVLARLDRGVEVAAERLAGWSDEDLSVTWRMHDGERTLIEATRLEMLRSVLFNHSYHHRGQLTVYLRMLDVPLPSVYGPTADESPFD